MSICMRRRKCFCVCVCATQICFGLEETVRTIFSHVLMELTEIHLQFSWLVFGKGTNIFNSFLDFRLSSMGSIFIYLCVVLSVTFCAYYLLFTHEIMVYLWNAHTVIMESGDHLTWFLLHSISLCHLDLETWTTTIRNNFITFPKCRHHRRHHSSHQPSLIHYRIMFDEEN